MTSYNFNHLTTEQLETLDAEVTKSMRALTAWSNRNLSKTKRASVYAMLVEKSRAITDEQMKREGAAA